jgi:hypothetical protein
MVVGGEFVSLVDPIEDIDVAPGTELVADRPEQIGSERRRVPHDLT